MLKIHFFYICLIIYQASLYDREVQIRCDTRTLLATFLASTLAVAKYPLVDMDPPTKLSF